MGKGYVQVQVLDTKIYGFEFHILSFFIDALSKGLKFPKEGLNCLKKVLDGLGTLDVVSNTYHTSVSSPPPPPSRSSSPAIRTH